MYESGGQYLMVASNWYQSPGRQRRGRAIEPPKVEISLERTGLLANQKYAGEWWVMGRVKGGFRRVFSASMLCLLMLAVSGCNDGSSPDSVITGNLDGVVQVQNEAVFTLASTLDNSPVVAKDVSPIIKSVRVRSTKSTGEEVVSAPIEVAPVISVKIPTDSTQVQIDYLDNDAKVKEIWGGQLPPLTSGSEFIVRNPDPDPTEGLEKLEITGPATSPFGIPTQFRALATYDDNTVRDVTRSATFVVENRSGLMAGGVLGDNARLRLGVDSVRISASFGNLTTSPLRTRFVNSTPSGNLFFSDSTGQLRVGALELESFGARAQMRAFSDFSDGIRREVTLALSYSASPLGIIEVNTLGQITGFDAGVTTLQGLLNFRRTTPAQVAVTVLRGFLDTMYSKNAVLPDTVEGLSSVYGLGDINGDGRTDIVGIPAFPTDREPGDDNPPQPDFSKVAIYLGNGDGTFQNPARGELVVPLPFAGADQGFVKFVTVGSTVYAAVGAVGSNQLALVAGPSLNRRGIRLFPSVTNVPLSTELTKLMQMSDASGLLLVHGGRENSLTSVLVGPPESRDSNTPRFSVNRLSYDLIEDGDYLEGRGDYLFHHRLNSRSLDILKVSVGLGRSSVERLKSISLDNDARVVDAQLGPAGTVVVNRRTSQVQPALVAVRDLEPGSSNANALLLNNLLDGNEFDSGTPLSIGELAPSTLSSMFLEAANRRTPSLLITGERFFDGFETGEVRALGVTVPAIGGTALRTTDLTNVSANFRRFEVGDVTGDGTSDIVSWQNGVISIIRLAAFDRAL